MRTRYKILIGIFTFLLICASLLFWRYQWVQSKYAEDYVALENEILLPDSEGRGFSDKVNSKINEFTKNQEIKRSITDYAKAIRSLSRSRNEAEFFENYKKVLIRQSCFLYIKSKNSSIPNSEYFSREDLYDNLDMKNYIQYLNNYKFGSRSLDEKMGEFVNYLANLKKDDLAKQCVDVREE